MPRIYPSLVYDDARAAIDELCAAFGFEEVMVVGGPHGTVAHAELRLDDAWVMCGSARGTGSTLDGQVDASVGAGIVYVAVQDVDAHHDRAAAAGVTITMGLTNTDYGSRDYGARDREGNRWHFGTYDPAAGPD